jgi:hypothetical protein
MLDPAVVQGLPFFLQGGLDDGGGEDQAAFGGQFDGQGGEGVPVGGPQPIMQLRVGQDLFAKAIQIPPLVADIHHLRPQAKPMTEDKEM